MSYDISLDTIRQARERIKGYIRHTPIMVRPPGQDTLPQGLMFKLENMQVVGSFKPRGVFNNLLQLDEATLKRGVIGASGGNHGVALAYGAARLGIPGVVYLPLSASADRAARVKAWGAELVQFGSVWDETHAEATRRAAAEGMTYIHPFDAGNTIAGQGTLGLELLDDVPDVDLVLISIGGGGLIGGMAAAIKQSNPNVKIIGVEPVGAPTLKHSLDLGYVDPLPEIRTIADTLAPRSISQRTLDLAQKYVDEVVLVEDAAMIDAQRWMWLHYNQMLEPAGAAVVAAFPQANLGAYKHPVALICGGNAAAETIWQQYEALGIQKGSILSKA